MEINPQMTAKPAHIIHSVPGRLRIKVLGAHDEIEFFSAVQKIIGDLSGVDDVHVRPASSSIVIEYRAPDAMFHEQLANHPQLLSWLQLVGTTPSATRIDERVVVHRRTARHHSRLAETILMSAEHLDANIRNASGGLLDLKVLMPFGVAIVTTLHKSRGKSTPMWMSVSTFAFNAFVALHRHRIEAPIVQIVSRVFPRR